MTIGYVEIAASIAGAMATMATTAVSALFFRLRRLEARQDVDEVRINRLQETEREVTELKVTNARILERLEHLPTQSDLQLLHDRISRNGQTNEQTAKDVAVMTESMKGVRTAVDRLHRLEEARESR